MADPLHLVAGAIASRDSAGLLPFLRGVYESKPIEDAAARQSALQLGLLEVREGAAELTMLGYLVGNVAKEYCNWVDAGRSMPPPRPPDSLLAGRDVLDVGCSFGRWLWEFQRVARSVMGVERQPEYPVLGAALAQREGLAPPRILSGSAESLDTLFEPASFDLVFIRLVLNHVAILPALRQARRVLRPGGVLWGEVESLGRAMQVMFAPPRRLRTQLFGAFAVVNSLVCMATNRQVAIRVPGRMHDRHQAAFPSNRWWEHATLLAGFESFRVESFARGVLAFSARAAQS